MVHTWNRPSSLVYVFVVLSLASFLVLFTVWRDPGISYETATTFQTNSTRQRLRAQLLQPEFVLESLHDAKLINGSSTKEMLKIAEEITKRMSVRIASREDVVLGQLTLVTTHPKAAIRLLDSMMQKAAARRNQDVISFAVQPAAIARMRGGSVTPAKLLLLAACSCLVGLWAVFLARKARANSLLYTTQEVKEIAGVPVIADFVDAANFPAREGHMARRRLARVAMRTAELTIAAVFLLMVYQLTTRDEFPTRFLQDPLAAYGEVLTRLIG